MTAIWGPLGWMTLHSVSLSYPESPTPNEQQLMTTWLDLFRDTITCATCKQHFTTTLQNYRMRFPRMMESRQSFAMFAFRVHNTVNARLSKPVYGTLAECMEVLRTNTKTRTGADYRISYINHITRYWKTMQDVTGIVALKKVAELKKIEIEYVGPRDTKFAVTLAEDQVVIPRNWVEADAAAPPRQTIAYSPTKPMRAGIQFVGGRIRLL